MVPISAARRIVIKIGSSLLIDAKDGLLRTDWLDSLATDVAEIRKGGSDVVVVSSGSIALGQEMLNLSGALTLEQSQACAAVGQIRLASAYDAALQRHALRAAQVLVTLEDSADRRRYLNSRATMNALLDLGVIPIVNENDTIATDEIRYGDNDRLAAQVAVTIGADMLILLSDVDGFYSGNPSKDKSAHRFDVIEEISPDIEAMAGEAGSEFSRGGMKTKLIAAKMATHAGCGMAITLGTLEHPLARLRAGAAATWFPALGDPQTARKSWIESMKPKGLVRLDAGAAAALYLGKSLLPAGITAIEGDFGRGDPVTIADVEGRALGQGLSRYTAREARTIQGRQSSDFAALLGYSGRAAFIHRDDMVLK